MQLKTYILIAAWLPLLVFCLLTLRSERYWRHAALQARLDADQRLQQIVACHQTVKQQRDIKATSDCAARDRMWAALFKQESEDEAKVAQAKAQEQLKKQPK